MKKTGWIDIFDCADPAAKKLGADPVSMITQAARNFGEYDAAAIIGHMHETAPRLATVDALRVAGTKLQAKLRDVHEALIEAVHSKMYDRVSGSFYPNLNGKGCVLRHVAFEGANPVILKTLPPVSFSEDGEQVITCTTLPIEATNFAEREVIMDFTTEQLAVIKEIAGKQVADALGGVATKVEVKNFAEDIKKQIGEIKPGTAPVDFAEALKPITERLEKAEKTAAAAVTELKHTRIVNFAEAQVREGKMLPADMAREVRFMMGLDATAKTIDFAEPDGKTSKITQLDEYQDAVAKRPKIGPALGELAGGAGDVVNFAEADAGKYYDEHPEFKTAGISRDHFVTNRDRIMKDIKK